MRVEQTDVASLDPGISRHLKRHDADRFSGELGNPVASFDR